MDTGQAELEVLWKAYVERFSGRRVAAAASFVLIPLIGGVGWVVQSPAVGVTAAAGVFACLVFLVAFAMAHQEVETTPSPSKANGLPSAADARLPTPRARPARS